MTRPRDRVLMAAALLALPLLSAGCQRNVARSRPAPAVASACRAEVDRVYSAQNRMDLSTRDQRDTPFAAGYLAGNTTRDLGAEYGRDNMYTSCLNNAADPGPAPAAGAAPPSANISPTFSPAVR